MGEDSQEEWQIHYKGNVMCGHKSLNIEHRHIKVCGINLGNTARELL